MIDFLTILSLLLGGGLILTAAIGVVRLPDVLCRSHAVAKALTLGVFLMLMGLWLQLDDPGHGLKIVLAIFFQVLTIPVSSHLVGLLAWQRDLPRWKHQPAADHRASAADSPPPAQTPPPA